MHIRSEQASDLGAIRAVNTAAFPTPAEADLVDKLREQGAVCASLVACVADEVVGHALFSHAQLVFQDRSLAIGALGPVAVLPKQQRSGFGAALIREGLARCKALGLPAVIVLGHPDYYPRFGFHRADTSRIRCEFEVPPEAFMICWFAEPWNEPALARYHPAFSDV